MNKQNLEARSESTGKAYIVFICLLILIIASVMISVIYRSKDQNNQTSNNFSTDIPASDTAVITEEDIDIYVKSGDIEGLIRKYKSNIIVTKNTRLNHGNDAIFELQEGSAIFQVKKQADETKGIRVKTLIAEIVSQGTIFQVSTIYPLNANLLIVIEGTVLLKTSFVKKPVSENRIVLFNSNEIVYEGDFKDLAALPKLQNSDRETAKNNPANTESASADFVKKTSNEAATPFVKRVETFLDLYGRNEKSTEHIKVAKDLLNIDFKHYASELKKIKEVLSKSKDPDLRDVMEELLSSTDTAFFTKIAGTLATLSKKYGLRAELLILFGIVNEVMRSDLTDAQINEVESLAETYIEKMSEKGRFDFEIENVFYYYDLCVKFYNELVARNYLKYDETSMWSIPLYSSLTDEFNRGQIINYLKAGLRADEELISKLTPYVDSVVSSLKLSKNRREEILVFIDFIKGVAQNLNEKQLTAIKKLSASGIPLR
ncbi:MAG: hypothetical protein HY606_10740 [Planctomycetes bacterium]|nr:hypothetical protein [Planctomycetota bacterium]